MPNNQERQPRQGRIVLRGQSHAGKYEQQTRDDDPLARSVVQRSASHQRTRDEKEEEQFGAFDYLLIVFIFILLIAIITVIVLFIRNFVSPTAFSFDPTLFRNLLILLVVYVLCVGAGILWGRHQSLTEAHRENSLLHGEINQLRNEKATVETQLRAALAATPPTPSASAGPALVSPALVNVVPTPPKQIEPMQPLRSLYDSERDPNDYMGIEKQQHPHEKVFPPNGTKMHLRSGWEIIGASRRGYGHAYEGKYREDDFNIKTVQVGSTQQDIVLVAIADGVGSKAFSRRGAYASVQGATKLIDDQPIQELSRLIANNASLPECEQAALAILMDSLQAAHDSVEQQAQHDGIVVDEMQSTLLVFVAAPLGPQRLLVASTQIGDGALFSLQPSKGNTPRERWRCLQQPQIQGSGNEVQPFMRTGPDVWKGYCKCDLLEDASFMMGMTDGTADDIEPPRPSSENRDPDPFFLVDDFYKHIEKDALKDRQPASELLKFLAYKKKTSHDDRTVVCLYRS